jgi:hypothetical protein
MDIAQIHAQQLPRSAWLDEIEFLFSDTKPTPLVSGIDGLNHQASPALIAAQQKLSGVKSSPP